MATQITLYFLQASRSIRIAWLLEELGLEYDIVFAEREHGIAPEWLKNQVGGLGKLPALKDGDLIFYESGNITEYLCDKYDKDHHLLPAPGYSNRYAVLQWVHAAEATFMLFGLSILYCRWFQRDGDKEATEEGLRKNVVKSLDFLEGFLSTSNGEFIAGDHPTAADTMMEFSLDFLLTRELGTKDKSWPKVDEYLKSCHKTATWQKAVHRSGHKL